MRTIRIAAVGYVPPPHDHHGKGVKLDPLAEVIRRVAREETPDFICFPEMCACAGPLEQAMRHAPALEPFVAVVGMLAREARAALIVPTLERAGKQVYNSVPIVDASGKLVLVYHKNYLTIDEGEIEAGITPGVEVPVAECGSRRVVTEGYGEHPGPRGRGGRCGGCPRTRSEATRVSRAPGQRGDTVPPGTRQGVRP
jgi:predicted amidohydrolase